MSQGFISIFVLGNESHVKEDAILSTFNHESVPSLCVQNNSTFRMRNVLEKCGRWCYMDIMHKEQISHLDIRFGFVSNFNGCLFILCHHVGA